MDGMVLPVRTSVDIVLGLMCVFIQMVAAQVIVVMVISEIHVLMVSLSFIDVTFYLFSKNVIVI